MRSPENRSWKPFAAWATGSKDKLFVRARLQLTIIYIVIQFIILITFSAILYYGLAYNIREKFDASATIEDSSLPDPDAIVDGLKNNIIVIDGGVLIVVGFLSYFLAGWTMRPISEALKRQREFSADASHELRTPLTVMKTQSEVLLQNKNAHENDFHSLALSNLEEIDRMSTLVDNLLQLSRGDGGQIIHQMQAVALRGVAESTVKKMQPLADKKNIALLIDGADEGNIAGDSPALGRMIANLVKNALQHTSSGGTVTISIEEGEHIVKLKIIDTGTGIAEKDLPRVFERFYKADASRTSHESGAGLGLPIVKTIVEAHKGSIHIDSQVNKGTTVTIELPKKVGQRRAQSS